MLVVGLGAAGVAVTKMMLASGVTHIVGCDRQGALSTEPRRLRVGRDDRDQALVRGELEPRPAQRPARRRDRGHGPLRRPLRARGSSSAESLGKMNDDAIVFAMANPNPEVMPEDAAPYVRIMATGRSDYPNQINNVLAFPGIFRGALDAGAPRITEEMKLAAAKGIADGRHRGGPLRGLHHPQRLQPRSRARRSPRRSSRRPSATGIARFNEETGTFATVGGRLDRREGPRHRRQRLHRLGALRLAAGPRRQVVGLTRDPERARSTNPTRHLARLGADPGTPAGRRPSRASTASSTWSARRSTSAGPTRPSSGSWRAAAPAPATWSAGDRRPRAQAARSWSASRRSATTATAATRSSTSRRGPGEGFDAEVVQEWEKAAREVEATGVRLVDRPHRPRARPRAAGC